MKTIDLEASASPEALDALNGMLRSLQGALREVLGHPVGRSGWTETVQRHLDEAFDAYDRYRMVVETAHPVSCRKGCTACCHDNPRGVTGVELLRLTEAVDRLKDGPEIRHHFRRLAEQRTDAASWRSRGEPCPLLKDGQCRTYALRPIACRAFVALTPAEWCSPQDPHYPDRLNPHLDPPRVILQLLAAISERLGLPAPTDLHRGMAG